MSSNPPERGNTAGSVIPRMLDSLRALALAEESNADRLKLRGKVAWFGDTVVNVWKAVIIVTVWATVVAVADFVYGRDLNLSNQVVPLLSVVVGLMLVFRNTTAYARWDEGRKTFTSLQSLVRNLARDYWISIGAPPPGHDMNIEILSPDEIRTKARCLRLMVAFVIAVKRHIRGQYGIDYEDLRAVLPPVFYQQINTPGFGYDAADADIENPIHTEVLTDRSPDLSGDSGLEPGTTNSSTNQVTSSAIPSRSAPRDCKSRRRPTSVFATQVEEWQGADLANSMSETSPLLRKMASDHRLEDSTAVVVHNYLARPSLPLPLGVMTMTDLFGQMETLADVKIPACYGIHLKQCTTLYLFALPLTLASDLKWMLIPFVTIVAFTLMGIEALARECEDPFGTDASDLPLDYMCAELRNEIEHLIAKLGPNPHKDIMF
ncbi:Bestrophin, RFP-TM, chloride channel-domain-containing protein [Melampsora americana]|nr:Bestrophin, RFP-TM, chloride channel-domain-containing protein [Melampsora americana]